MSFKEDSMSNTNLDQQNDVTSETNVTNEATVPTGETDGDQENKRIRRRRFEQVYVQMRRGIDLSLTDSQIQTDMSRFGYAVEDIQAAKTLLDTLQQKRDEQLEKYDRKYAAVKEFNAAWDSSVEAFLHIRETARLAFKKNPVMYDELGLGREIRKDYGGWESQVRQFFNKLLATPDAVAGLALYNLPQAELEAARQLVLDLEAKDNLKQDAIAEAQKSTEEKNKIFTELKTWFTEYTTVARIALKYDKQKLEKFGLTTPAAH